MSDLAPEGFAPEPDMTGNTPPSEPAEAPFSISPEQWAESQANQQAVLDWIASQQQPQQPYEQGPQRPGIDLFADDAEDQIFGLVQNAVQQAMSPYAEWQQSQQMTEAEDRAYDIIDDIVAREGEFASGELAHPMILARAESFYQEEAQRLGYGPQAAESAINRAAAEVRAYEKAVREAGIAQHTNQLATLSGQPGEPGSQYAVGTQTRVTPDYRAGGSVADHFFNGG